MGAAICALALYGVVMSAVFAIVIAGCSVVGLPDFWTGVIVGVIWALSVVLVVEMASEQDEG